MLLEKISSRDVSFGKRKTAVQTSPKSAKSNFAKGFITASLMAVGIYGLSKKGVFANENIKKFFASLKKLPYLILGFLVGIFSSFKNEKKTKDETNEDAKIEIIQQETEEKPIEQNVAPIIEEEREETHFEPEIIEKTNADDVDKSDEIIEEPIIATDKVDIEDDKITKEEISSEEFNDIKPLKFDDDFLIRKLGPKNTEKTEIFDFFPAELKQKRDGIKEETSQDLFKGSTYIPAETKSKNIENNEAEILKSTERIRKKYRNKRY